VFKLRSMKSFLHCFVFSGVAAAAMAVISPGIALAQDPPSDPLPQLPSANSGAAPAPGSTTSDIPVVSAGVVNTHKVDTVVVAEPGSNVTVHGQKARPAHPEYAPDPARRAAMIASPIVLGVGGAAAGIAYISARNSQHCTFSTVSTANGFTEAENCAHDNAVPSLVLYDVIVGAVPSAPRWVVGDVGGALLYTGLRGGSLLVASVIDWGSDSSSWIGPFTLGFLVPMTLAIVDMATTPHREDLQPQQKSPADQAKALRPRITGLSPAPVSDAQHRLQGAVLGLTATF